MPLESIHVPASKIWIGCTVCADLETLIYIGYNRPKAMASSSRENVQKCPKMSTLRRIETAENATEDQEESLLSAQQMQFVALHLDGVPRKAIASQLKINERTIRRWLEEEPIKQELALVQKAIRQEVAAKIIGTSRRAIEVILELINDPDTPANVRFSAATKLLSMAGIEEFAALKPATQATGDVTPEQLNKVLYQIYGLVPPVAPPAQPATGGAKNMP